MRAAAQLGMPAAAVAAIDKRIFFAQNGHQTAFALGTAAITALGLKVLRPFSPFCLTPCLTPSLAPQAKIPSPSAARTAVQSGNRHRECRE